MRLRADRATGVRSMLLPQCHLRIKWGNSEAQSNTGQSVDDAQSPEICLVARIIARAVPPCQRRAAPVLLPAPGFEPGWRWELA